ncbi:MAG: iron-dependent repressor [Bacteroidetes bacterium]|nr:MAG: iron-dependent repressor [Bacteroidota bacterium]
MNTLAEENYLKAIYQLSGENNTGVSTNDIAKQIKTKASSVSDMLRKLSNKRLADYEKYKGATLTKSGKKVALKVIRKHRLWELFLVNKLDFKWDEVHEIAEQLEHIVSPEMVNRLDKFLDYPKYDPHGDPIPDKNGNIRVRKEVFLSDLSKNQIARVVGVKDSSASFLQYLESVKLLLGTELVLLNRYKFDNSLSLKLGAKKEITISNKVAQNLYVSTT